MTQDPTTLQPRTSATDIVFERGQTHGRFDINAFYSQSLKAIIHRPRGFELTSVQMEALDLICTKISRILSGGNFNDDNWLDIQGYCQLVRNELSTIQQQGVEADDDSK